MLMVTQEELGITHYCDVVEINGKSVCGIYDKNPLNQLWIRDIFNLE